MKEASDQRVLKDRRKEPTPGLSLYTLFGRRKAIRRRDEKEKGGYVDRYGHKLFFFLVLIIGLNVLDAFLTIMILDAKGWELNPVVHSVITLWGSRFWIWKFAMVSTCIVLLCLHSKFKRVREIIVALSAIYLGVVLYQIHLLVFQVP